MNAYWKIIRPNVCFLAVLGVFVGAVLSSVYDVTLVLPALAAAFFICAGGNVINDFFDFEIDKINKPKRPLPSGKISPGRALSYYLLLSAAGIGLSLSVSVPFFWIAVFNFLVSTLYAWKLKKIAIIGNITDSFLAAVTFLAGGLIAGSFFDILNSPVLVLAFIAFLTTMGREIFKDVEDMKGDKALGARTLPILAGGAISMNIARMFAALGALSAVLPYMTQMFGEYYIISAMPCMCVLLYSATLKDPKRAQKMVKIGMFLGIFAFLVGAYFG